MGAVIAAPKLRRSLTIEVILSCRALASDKEQRHHDFAAKRKKVKKIVKEPNDFEAPG